MGAWIEIKKKYTMWVKQGRRSPRGSVDWNPKCFWTEYRQHESLPSWERGLKFALEQVKDKEEPSLPSWERGLKYLHWRLFLPTWRRSPRGSVDWNPSVWFFLYPTIVAPLVGAWIEIVTDPASCTRSESLPSWERGLKFWQDQGTDRLWSVAPLAGATLEIEKTIVYNVLYDYIEGGHLIEQDGQAKQLGNGNAYGSPILEKRNDTGRIRDGKQIFE